MEREGLHAHQNVALLCGPPVMMSGSVATLGRMGFRDEQIFVSNERHMKCATGMCGHCMLEGKYTCHDGPVFRWDEIKDLKG
jgi:NAD(P)H-flavin reductase